MSDAMLWATIGNFVSMGISLLCYLALLVVALVFVGKRSPSAAAMMAGAAVVFLLTTIASPFAHAGTARAGQPEDYAQVLGVVNLAFGVVRAAGWGLLLVGIVKVVSDRSATAN
jgi:hypothetical protein